LNGDLIKNYEEGKQRFDFLVENKKNRFMNLFTNLFNFWLCPQGRENKIERKAKEKVGATLKI